MILKTKIPKQNIYSRLIKGLFKNQYESKYINAVDLVYIIKKHLDLLGYENVWVITHEPDDFLIELHVIPRGEITREDK